MKKSVLPDSPPGSAIGADMEMDDELDGLSDWKLVLAEQVLPVSAPMPDDRVSDLDRDRRWSLGLSVMDSEKLRGMIGRRGVLLGPDNVRVGEVRIEKVSQELDLIVVQQVDTNLSDRETVELPVAE